jgi:hypothetical protein
LVLLALKKFESCLIIVEAKREVTFTAGLAQAVIYMGVCIFCFIYLGVNAKSIYL